MTPSDPPRLLIDGPSTRPGPVNPVVPLHDALKEGRREEAPGYGYYGEAEDAESGGFDFRYYLGVILRRRWSALTAFVVVLTFFVIQNYIAVPVYQSTARVLVETESLNLVDIEDVIDPRRYQDAELAVLRSRWLAKRTVESLGLLVTGGEAGTDGIDAVGDADGADAAVSDSTGIWSGARSAVRTFAAKAFGLGRQAPPVSQLAEATRDADERPFGALSEDPVEARRVTSFLGGLFVGFSDESSSVLDITYRSVDPVLAARFANAHAEQDITQNLERRFAAVEEVTGWLTERLAEQRERVDTSEENLARFREENALTTIEGASPTVTRLNELAASLTRTQAERLEREAVYNQALAQRSAPDSFDRLPVMAGDPALRDLRVELDQLQRERSRLSATLQPRHPTMVKLQDDIQAAQDRLATERERLLESVRQDIQALRASEAGLVEALDGLRADAISQDRKGVQLSVLTREAESNRQIYDILLQRAQETGVVTQTNPSQSRVLDQALVPEEPVSPDRQGNLLRGIGGGLLLAIAVAFGFERLDNRLRTPDEIRDHLELPFIGLLPEVERQGDTTPLLTPVLDSPQFSEELRHIRTNVLFSFSGDASRSMLVTSASPNEGKTVVASNLAVALAQAGERVLIVDADLRRPSTHLAFSVGQEPGLSNVLVGDAKPSQAIQRSAIANLWILPAGRQPPNPSELLSSPAFKKFLAQLGEHFSWIIFDTPPVIAVTDASVLAHEVTGVLFVVGSDRVSRQVARRAIGQLRAANGKLVGGVLNHVDVQGNRYYYSGYSAAYDRKYGDYYQEPTAASSGSGRWRKERQA